MKQQQRLSTYIRRGLNAIRKNLFIVFFSCSILSLFISVFTLNTDYTPILLWSLSGIFIVLGIIELILGLERESAKWERERVKVNAEFAVKMEERKKEIEEEKKLDILLNMYLNNKCIATALIVAKYLERMEAGDDYVFNEDE